MRGAIAMETGGTPRSAWSWWALTSASDLYSILSSSLQLLFLLCQRLMFHSSEASHDFSSGGLHMFYNSEGHHQERGPLHEWVWLNSQQCSSSSHLSDTGRWRPRSSDGTTAASLSLSLSRKLRGHCVLTERAAATDFCFCSCSARLMYLPVSICPSGCVPGTF